MKQSNGILALFVFVALLELICCEVVFRWTWNELEISPLGNRKWRPTSFAVTEKKIYMTLLDMNKSSSGNAIVGSFDKGKSYR